MKNVKLPTAFATLALLVSGMVNAAAVEVEWSDPDSYRDIRPANESREGFKQRTFKDFEKIFAKLAAKLPEDNTLKLKVTDVDLAGSVEFGRTQPIRVVRTIDFPRIDFSYQLLDGKQQVIASEEVSLKDMNFMSNNQARFKNQSLGYEELMLERWFDKTMKDYIVQTK
ncbi:DUF3016 domain-containing protein [Colwellia sp. MEBiC06753]